MNPVAVSSLCKSYDLFRSMLASSKWLQRMVLAPESSYENLALIDANDSRLSVDAALERVVPEVFGDAVEGAAEPFTARPFILARYDIENTLERESQSHYRRQDSFTVDIEFVIPQELRQYTSHSALWRYYDAANKVGQLVSDWKTAGITATATAIQFESWNRESFGQIDPKEVNADWIWGASFRATFQGSC